MTSGCTRRSASVLIPKSLTFQVIAASELKAKGVDRGEDVACEHCHSNWDI
jgi:hypothetical protein